VPALETFAFVEALEMPVNILRRFQGAVEILVHCVPEDINTYIVSDKHWLAENILCLLSNAVKYSNSGCVTLAATLQHNVKKYSFDDEDPPQDQPPYQQLLPFSNSSGNSSNSSSFYASVEVLTTLSTDQGNNDAVGSLAPRTAESTGNGGVGLRRRTSAAVVKASSAASTSQDSGGIDGLGGVEGLNDLHGNSRESGPLLVAGLNAPPGLQQQHQRSSSITGVNAVPIYPRYNRSSSANSSMDTSPLNTPRDDATDRGGPWDGESTSKPGTATGTATVSSDFGTATGSEQHVRAARTQSMVRITVEDNGIGLSAEARSGLFRVR
jgi:hypothetical protein